jgi:hypothetical protein
MRPSPQDEILIALMRNTKPGKGSLTIAEIASLTGRAQSTCRYNLQAMARKHPYIDSAWVVGLQPSGKAAVRFVLTAKGREIARLRARRNR